MTRRLSHARRRTFRSAKRKRGVSDVVATILLLALTVTLFASIFAFVTSFPAPLSQNNNQFQASLLFPSNGSTTWVSGIKIVHLAGPSVPGTALIYLKSATQPSAPEFASPYTVASGISGTVWNLGQSWVLTFPLTEMPSAHGNLTVYLVSGGQLLFSVILPGATLVAAPTVVATSVYPSTPSIGQVYTVNATLAGSYASNSVFVNLAGVSGGPSKAVQMTINSNGQWTYTVGAANVPTAAGTYYAFVNATGPNGLTGIGSILIKISSSGSSSNGPLSVGVVLVPSPPNSGVAESVQAVVTYTGTALSSAASVSVTFSATSSPSGYTYSGSGPTGVTISGPGGPASVTVASTSVWTIPNPTSLTLYTYTVSATATVTGVGTITGTTSFTPATVTVGPTSGLMGAVVTARGAGFAASTNVNLTLGGVRVTPYGSSNATCTFSTSVITTTSTGTFVCQFQVPNGAPSGATLLSAVDLASGQNDTAPFTVTPWTLSVGISPGLVGATVTARGAGFAAGSSITLTFDGNKITPYGTTNSTCTFVTTTITATSTGSFVCQFVIPSAVTPGAASAVATDSTSGQVATYSGFTVTPWTITLSPTSGSKSTSTTVTITGAGFQGSSKVSITFNGAIIAPTCTSGVVYGDNINITAAGGFVCTYAEGTGSAGVYAFVANDATSGQTATAYFTRT